MDKNTILESMEHIDPKLIEDADRGVKSGRSTFKKSLLIAACVCLLLITTALAAGVFFGTPEIEYLEDVSLEHLGETPTDGFTGVLEQQTGEPVSTNVSLESFNEAFLADVANRPEGEPTLQYYFDAWSDLEEYIGFNLLDNPVLDEAEAKTIKINGVEAHGHMLCTQNDNLLVSARAQAHYRIYKKVPSGYPGIILNQPVDIKIHADVFTEHCSGEGGFANYRFADGSEFTDELYTSPNGRTFRIVRVQTTDPDVVGELVYFYGLVCINNVYISVQSIYFPNEAVALSTLKEVLDGFVIGEDLAEEHFETPRDGFTGVLEQQTGQADGEPVSTKVALESFNEAFLVDVANRPEGEPTFNYYFDAWSDLEEYIGFNLLDNPVLDEAEPKTYQAGDVETHGRMFCTQIDNILTCARAKAEYQMNETEFPSGYPGINNTAHVTITVEAAVYTEHSPIEESEMFPNYLFADGSEFTDELYTSPNGHTFRIVRVLSGDAKAVSFFGLACIDNVYISVRSMFGPDEAHALSTLKEVLDGFVIG